MDAPVTKFCPLCGNTGSSGRFCSNCGHKIDCEAVIAHLSAEKKLKEHGYRDMSSIVGVPTKLGKFTQMFYSKLEGITLESIFIFKGTSRRRDIPRIIDVVAIIELDNEQAWIANHIATSVADALKSAKKASGIARFGFSVLFTMYVFYDHITHSRARAIHGQVATNFAFWMGRPQVRIVAISLHDRKMIGGSNSVAETYIEGVLRKLGPISVADEPAAKESLLLGFVGEHLSPIAKLLRELGVALNPELIAHRIKNQLLVIKDLYAIVLTSCVISIGIDKIFGIDSFNFVDFPIISEIIPSAVIVAIWAAMAVLLYPLLKLFGGSATLRETIIATLYASAIMSPINFLVQNAFANAPESTMMVSQASNALLALYYWPIIDALHDMGPLRMFGLAFVFMTTIAGFIIIFA